ncbi:MULTISPECIES: ATP-grasp domain-containing protein [Halanaerobium]|jgi:hypothetical protein|nr:MULTISPECIES: ATP-grasp domain-containing protein [Halanaerobium]KXS49556.1 MAG: COG1821 family protein [Halanaerobium sp. T82-1]PUU92008.1 MAG: COG1821 family protein [Halanaerobium sp.]
MKVFILEYFLSKKRNSIFKESFYREGKFMLDSLIKSFAKIEDLQLSIFIAQENIDLIDHQNHDIEIIVSDEGSCDSYFEKLLDLDLSQSDYFLVIAPETDNLLYQITKIMETKNINNLGCSSNCIKKAANKWLLYQNFKDTDIKIPESYQIKNNKLDLRKDFFPAVIKAKYSAGSELKIIKSKKEFSNLNLSNYKGQIIQKIITGIPGSLSLAANSTNLRILSINKQLIRADDFSYFGSIINHRFPNQHKLKELANLVKKKYPNLNGYFGIDFICNQKGFYLLEINPRLSSSFIGLAEISEPAEIILNLAEKKNFIGSNLLSSKEFTFYLD